MVLQMYFFTMVSAYYSFTEEMEAEQETKGHKCQDFLTSWEYSGLLMEKKQTNNKPPNEKPNPNNPQIKNSIQLKSRIRHQETWHKLSKPAEQNNGC